MRRTKGFSLIEVVVAIAIMAILAGAVAPLVMKSLNQQRASVTQANLQAAWQAAFGIPGTRVQNMRADYGFNPTTTNNLAAMVTFPGAAVTQTYGTSAYFSYGWNGPYWNGPTTTSNGATVPADAWGQAIQLVVNPTNGTCQMVSPGGGTQLVYPTTPVSLSGAYMGSICLNISNSWAVAAAAGGVAIHDRRNGQPYPVWTDSAATVAVNSTYQPTVAGVAVKPIWPVMPGPVSISISFPSVNQNIPGQPGYDSSQPTHLSYGGTTFNQVLDILPGQSQVISLNLN